MTRKKDICPACGEMSEVVYSLDKCIYEDNKGNKSIYPGQAIHWKCSKCKLDWDINENFKCIFCGKEVHGRYLFCSKDCEIKSEKEME